MSCTPCETDVRLCEELETDEEVEVDMDTDVLTVLRTGKQYPLKPIGDVGSRQDAPTLHPVTSGAYCLTCC